MLYELMIDVLSSIEGGYTRVIGPFWMLWVLTVPFLYWMILYIITKITGWGPKGFEINLPFSWSWIGYPSGLVFFVSAAMIENCSRTSNLSFVVYPIIIASGILALVSVHKGLTTVRCPECGASYSHITHHSINNSPMHEFECLRCGWKGIGEMGDKSHIGIP